MDARDWTPLPLPTHDQVEHAAGQLARLAEFEELQRGGVTFRRRDLALLGWWDPAVVEDWDTYMGEIAVFPIPEAMIDAVNPERDRGQLLARSRLAVRHAIERRDQSMALMGEALEGKD